MDVTSACRWARGLNYRGPPRKWLPEFPNLKAAFGEVIAAGRILGQRDNVGKLVDLAKAMMESEDPNPRLVHDVIGIIHFLAASDYLLANAKRVIRDAWALSQRPE